MNVLDLQKSGLVFDVEDEKNFVLYKVLNIGEEILDNYKEGDVIFVEDSHTNIVNYGNNKFYLIDDAFVVAQLV